MKANIRYVFDKHKRASNKVKALIYLEIYLNKKRTRISTGIKVYLDQWHERKMVINSTASTEYNSQLDNIMLVAIKWAEESEDIEELKSRLSFKVQKKISYEEYVKNRSEQRTDIRESTRRRERVFARAVAEFGKFKQFSDLTRANIILFDNWVKSKGYKQPTVYNYHKHNKAYINEAIKEGLMETNPYMSISIDRGVSERIKYLTKEEISKIKDADLSPIPAIEKVRDLFLFQVYTGLAYSDMRLFDASNITEVKGAQTYQARRLKTNEVYYIVIIKQASDILGRYNNKLPVMSNEQYNMRLKILGEASGLAKPLTSHMGRHTFAVQALSNGVRIEVLAKMMGHSDIKTTQIYAKILGEDVISEFGKLDNL